MKREDWEKEWEEKVEEYEDEHVPPMPRWKWWLRAGVALIAITGLLYVAGIYPHIFLHRTPSGAQPSALPSKTEASLVPVPVVVHILSGSYGSERTEEDARRLITNANTIWSQANIAFHIQEIRHITVAIADLQAFELQPYTFIEQSGSYDPDTVNVYLTRTLQGVNGLAYGGTTAVSVADYTSTLDFRTLAHEFGHLLGLEHVKNRNQLMSTGATGVELTNEEITTARQQASPYMI